MSKYYHGGRPGLQRGAFLLPPEITRSKCSSDYGAAEVHRRDRVYVTTDPAAALMYAAGVRNGLVYECEPIGDLEPDPDCTMPGLSFQCPKARITKIIKPNPSAIQMARSVLLDPTI